jgi:hypothetical protein
MTAGDSQEVYSKGIYTFLNVEYKKRFACGRKEGIHMRRSGRDSHEKDRQGFTYERKAGIHMRRIGMDSHVKNRQGFTCEG